MSVLKPAITTGRVLERIPERMSAKRNPLSPEMSFVGEKPTDPLSLEVYLSRTAHCTLEEGDGAADITAARQPGATLVTIVGPERTYIVRAHGARAPRRVTVNNRPLVRRANENAFRASPDGWWPDPQGRVQVKVHGGGELRLRLLD